jgi:clan AA aspartic protease (TIGR02281 family)
MLKYATFYFVILISFSAFAQSDYDDGYIYMKCGTKLGKKRDLIDWCAEQYKDTNSKNAKTCVCKWTTIAKHYTFKEFSALVDIYGYDLTKIIYMDKDLATISEFEDCAKNQVEEKLFNTKGYESFEEEFPFDCISELKSNIDLKAVDINEFIYCSCIKEEIQKRGYTLLKLDQIKDKDPVFFNDVFILCMNKPGVLKETSISKNDVFGNSKYAYVPLINKAGSFEVKINFGNFSKYFILDSGASDILISSNFERELLLEGIIKTENYLTDNYYSLADGSIIKCRRILLNNIKIADFTVNNVIIAVINNSNNSLLLGKSFLDKFSNWAIDNKNSTLYLEK